MNQRTGFSARLHLWHGAVILIAATLLASCGSIQIGNVRFFGQSRTPHTIVTVSNSDPALDSRPSQNWSGYNVVRLHVTSITATWQVPQVQSPSVSDSSTWVGIGGVDSDTLIQAGTDQLMNQGKAEYYAWVEALPKAPQIVGEIDLLPGDTVTVTITETGAHSWSLKIVDHDANESAERSIDYSSCACSAEWIEEAPSINNRQATLADFTSVTFTQCAFTADSTIYTPGNAGARPVRMVDRDGRTIVQPQVLEDDSFSAVDIAGN